MKRSVTSWITTGTAICALFGCQVDEGERPQQPSDLGAAEMGQPDLPDIKDMPADLDAESPPDLVDVGAADLQDQADLPEGGEEMGASKIPAVEAWTFTDEGLVWEYERTIGTITDTFPASDVSVRADGQGGWVMAFTCIDFAREFVPTQICLARSEDGRSWEVERDPWFAGADPDVQYSWEASELVYQGGQLYVMASWYPAPNSPNAETFGSDQSGYPATLALMKPDQTGGVDVIDEALMAPRRGELDHHAVYSPGWVGTASGGHAVYYAGHCFPSAQMECPLTPGGVSLAWATASTIEGPWERRGEVVFEEPIPEWAGVFQAEPSVAFDGARYWMAVTGFNAAQQGFSIGLATSPTPEGPWTMRQDALVELEPDDAQWSAIVAPSIVIEPDMIHVWYSLIGKEKGVARLGYVKGEVNASR